MTVLGLLLLGVAGWIAAGTGSGAGRSWRMLQPAHRRKAPEVSAEEAASCALLLAACLEAGATPAAALRQAAAAGGDAGPVGPALMAAADQLEAGAARPPALETGALRAVGAVFGRSMLTGSAMSAQLVDTAAQLRSEVQFARLEQARRVGVLSVLPLGACLLPAFLLLAVVPAVLGLAVGL